MVDITIRAYRLKDSDDLALSAKDLSDYLNMDMGNNIGNDEKVEALHDALNNIEHIIAIRKRLYCLPESPTNPTYSPYYTLSIRLPCR